MKRIVVRYGSLATILALFLTAHSTPAAAPPSQPVKKGPQLKVPAVFEKKAPENAADLRAQQEHVKKVLANVMPAVVGIRQGMGAGSGVIISEDGYVLTAGHVSGAPNRDCTIILPSGRSVRAKTLGYNRGIDSGLIKITEKGKWPFVDMGDSSKLHPGQWCLAIGHPGGFKPGRTPVVRLGRIVLANKNLIRTDCTLVGGDSGGPLFDMQGRVIGIHSRIGMSILENIHVPVDTYRETWDRLVKAESWGGGLFGGGGRRRNAAYLGVVFDGEVDDLKIIEISKNSPAEKAGLKVGDVIVSINGKKVDRRAELAAFMSSKRAGEEVTLEVQRGKDAKTFTLKLGRRPAE